MERFELAPYEAQRLAAELAGPIQFAGSFAVSGAEASLAGEES